MTNPLSFVPPNKAATANAGPQAGRCSQVLNRRFRLERCLSSNTLGEIYSAHDLLRRASCSIKMLSRGNSVPEIAPFHRFQREAAMLSRLSHPNIVAVREFTEAENGAPFLVMEPLEGCTLQELLAGTGRLPVLRALEILCTVGRTLQFVHELGIVHRDVKPSSIFLNLERSAGSTSPAREVIKLFDFGLASDLCLAQPGADMQADSGIIVGTPAYMAPEILTASNPQPDGFSDQWSLGVIGYQLLCGHLPFQHEDPCFLGALIRTQEPELLDRLVPELPDSVRQAIHKALSKRKGDRHSSIRDFVRALQAPQQTTESQRATAAPTLKAIRTDLIALCRWECPDQDAAPVSMVVDDSTRPYSSDSFRHQILASVAEEPQHTETLPRSPRRNLYPWIVWGLAVMMAAMASIVTSWEFGISVSPLIEPSFQRSDTSQSIAQEPTAVTPAMKIPEVERPEARPNLGPPTSPQYKSRLPQAEPNQRRVHKAVAPPVSSEAPLIPAGEDIIFHAVDHPILNLPKGPSREPSMSRIEIME